MSESQPSAPVPDVCDFDDAIRAYQERMAALRYADASIYLIYSSDLWPPPAETTLGEGPAYGYCGRLSGFPDGHLAVMLERDDGTTPLHTEFQRVLLSEGSAFIISIQVKDERVTVTVGGKQLGPYRPEQDPLEIQGANVRI